LAPALSRWHPSTLRLSRLLMPPSTLSESSVIFQLQGEQNEWGPGEGAAGGTRAHLTVARA
jgi:hypothetical protein